MSSTGDQRDVTEKKSQRKASHALFWERAADNEHRWAKRSSLLIFLWSRAGRRDDGGLRGYTAFKRKPGALGEPRLAISLSHRKAGISAE
jgi:hypothetical protein